MKNNKLTEKIQPQQLPLVPAWILLPLWFVSLTVPNIIYSGISFADTLHILKWTITGVPVAIAVLVAGVRLFIYGRDRITFKLDAMSTIWALILVYCALQPLWVHVNSPTGYVLEMVCFVTVWAFYVISVSSFPGNALRPIILLANFNAAFNVLFAELQIRDMNNLNFLEGTFLAPLRKYSSIILPTPGNYIGNTAQQNMFGLWISIAVLGATYLYIYDAWKETPDEHGKVVLFPALSIILGIICIKFAVVEMYVVAAILAAVFIVGAFVIVWKLKGAKHAYLAVLILILLSINAWGVIRSTSRSAIYSLIGGFLIMSIIAVWKFNRNYVIRLGAAFAVICVIYWTSFYAPIGNPSIWEKTKEVFENVQEMGQRRGIWTTGYSMLLEHPEGVGIGQFKWHYIEAQREGFKRFPYDWYDWQYTHWAHNEYLQFFCEGGYVGGILFVLMFLTSFIAAFVGFFRKREINISAVWGFSLASLISFCALFTRPYHRIENIVWILLAFAMSNREFFPAMKLKMTYELLKSSFSRKLIGVACVVSSIAGCVYISSGIYGNYLLRQALSTRNANLQMYLLNEANKHPIVREDTQRHIAYHYLQIGEQTNNKELLAQGFNILWQQFQREPHSEDISRLINFAQRFQIEDVLRELHSYFKPGTYHLERRPQVDSNGQVINALLMIGGPGNDAE